MEKIVVQQWQKINKKTIKIKKKKQFTYYYQEHLAT